MLVSVLELLVQLGRVLVAIHWLPATPEVAIIATCLVIVVPIAQASILKINISWLLLHRDLG
jgi:hypothetical protein